VSNHRSFGARNAAALLVALTCAAACSGKTSSTPTGPTPTGPTGSTPTASQAPPGAPSFFLIPAINVAQRSLQLNWGLADGADRYVIEAGSTSGATDLATFSGNSSHLMTWSNISPREDIFVRVKAANAAGTGPPSREVRVDMPDMKLIIEALFFASGKYADQAPPRRQDQRMQGWAPGSRVSVRVPHAVGGDQFDAVVQAVNDLNAAMGGAVNFVVERAAVTLSDWIRLSPSGVSYTVGEGQCTRTPGGPADIACTFWEPSPIYAKVSIRIGSADLPKTWAHELGHSAGLQHLFPKVRVSVIPLNGLQAPIMGGLVVYTDDNGSFNQPWSGFKFTELEMEAVRMVYASGLRPGASIGDFVARGLITP
jgi:hypothetical protein